MQISATSSVLTDPFHTAAPNASSFSTPIAWNSVNQNRMPMIPNTRELRTDHPFPMGFPVFGTDAAVGHCRGPAPAKS